ncbi:GPI-anchor transamidase [Morella rubra]|uniref:GPI-anchor transamidase n=1 Tax=Morella rubra TaxID=262757 RepID=A0A6A1US01_9ROSI|nr:GPI-anchor transamidase [Morella rubra]
MKRKFLASSLAETKKIRFNMYESLGSRALVLLLFLLLGCNFSNCVAHTASSEVTMHTNNWAVLVCTSRFWFNYRHMANTLSLYRTVKRLEYLMRE